MFWGLQSNDKNTMGSLITLLDSRTDLGFGDGTIFYDIGGAVKGWLKLHREILKWEWYKDLPTRNVFLHFLLSAEYEDGSWRGEKLKAGQLITGRKKLAQELGLTEDQIRRATNTLQKTGEITIKTTNKYSVITIVRWDFFQQKPQQTPNSNTNKSPLPKNNRNKEINIISASKEFDENSSEEVFEIFWQDFPRQRRGSKEKAFRAFERARTRATDQEIMDGLTMYVRSAEVAKGYAKGAEAWLNDDRWSNEYRTPEEENARTNKRTSGDALAEIISEIRADSPLGEPMLRHSGQLRQITGPVENHDEGNDSGFAILPG